MAGLDEAQYPGRTPIAVAGDREPAEPVGGDAALALREVVAFGDLGHRARRLAGGEHHQPSGCRRSRAGAAASNWPDGRPRPLLGTAIEQCARMVLGKWRSLLVLVCKIGGTGQASRGLYRFGMITAAAG